MLFPPHRNPLTNLVNLQSNFEDTSFIVCSKNFSVLSHQFLAIHLELNIFIKPITPGTNIIDLIGKDQISDFLFYANKALKGETISIATSANPELEEKINISYEPYTENEQVVGFIFKIHSIWKRAGSPVFSKNFVKVKAIESGDLKSIFDQASIAMVIYSLEEERLIANNKVTDLLGYAGVEFSAMDFWEFTFSEDIEESKRLFSLVKKGAISNYYTEKRYIHKNGHLVWGQEHCSIVKDKNNFPKYIISIIQDINHQKDDELQIRKQELTFRFMFENAPIGMTRLDTNLRWITLNDKFCDIVGYTRDELKYLSHKVLTYPEDYISELIALDKLNRGVQNSYTKEMRYIHKLGYLVWVNVTVTLYRDSINNPLYYISIVQDINAKKKAEQELIIKNNELDTFLYKASHDLKGPVASLLGLSNLIQFEVQDKVAISYFEKMHEQALRMNTIISSLAEIGRIKELTPEIETINFVDILYTNLKALSNLPSYDTVDFKIISNTISDFYSDKNILSIIFHNILENAIKYQSPEGNPFVHIAVEELSKGVTISISDNGIGIPEEFEDKIFEMFFRGTEQSKGSGLGLYITKNAIDKLGGSIHLINKNTRLTEFSIYLPTLKP